MNYETNSECEHVLHYRAMSSIQIGSIDILPPGVFLGYIRRDKLLKFIKILN